jgi:hypothetical protein
MVYIIRLLVKCPASDYLGSGFIYSMTLLQTGRGYLAVTGFFRFAQKFDSNKNPALSASWILLYKRSSKIIIKGYSFLFIPLTHIQQAERAGHRRCFAAFIFWYIYTAKADLFCE